MVSKNTKRKSINLILIIFIILVIIALIILAVYLTTLSNENNNTSENNEITQNEQNNSIQMGVETNTNQTETNNLEDTNSTYNSIENLDDFEDITTNEIEDQTSSESQSLTFNNHTLTFDSSVDASIVQNNGTSELQLNYTDFNLQMLLGTDSSATFEDLKNNTSLNTYLESTYNMTITSSLKTGNISNLEVIICTMSDTNGQAYFIITPLNDYEIIYSKIYNTSDSQSLIEDLSKPLEELSVIISNLQN